MLHYADTTQYSIQEILLWERMRDEQGKVFHTTKGVSFTYNIQGNELFVSQKEKNITRATVNMAYQKVRELKGYVKGPKTLGAFVASYLYPMFVKIGVIKGHRMRGMKRSRSMWGRKRKGAVIVYDYQKEQYPCVSILLSKRWIDTQGEGI